METCSTRRQGHPGALCPLTSVVCSQFQTAVQHAGWGEDSKEGQPERLDMPQSTGVCWPHPHQLRTPDKLGERRNLWLIQKLPQVRLPISFSYGCISGVTATWMAAPPPTGHNWPGTRPWQLMGTSTRILLWPRTWAGLPHCSCTPQLAARSLGAACQPVPLHLPRAAHASLLGHSSQHVGSSSPLPARPHCRCQVHCPDMARSGLCIPSGPGHTWVRHMCGRGWVLSQGPSTC